MRLQLDSSTRPADSTLIAPAGSGTFSGGSTEPAGGRSGDSIGISGISLALNQLSTDRTSRIQQLTASVRSGEYGVSSAAVSSAIVAYARS